MEEAAEMQKEKVRVGKQDIPIPTLAKTIGYPNSGVICRNIDEVIGVISHGSLEAQISPDDAKKVMDFLVQVGKADEVDTEDGGKMWNIHSNPDASFQPAKSHGKKRR
jgi:hypothetical protein